MTHLQCECSYRRADSARRFNTRRVLVLNNPPSMTYVQCECLYRCPDSVRRFNTSRGLVLKSPPARARAAVFRDMSSLTMSWSSSHLSGADDLCGAESSEGIARDAALIAVAVASIQALSSSSSSSSSNEDHTHDILSHDAVKSMTPFM